MKSMNVPKLTVCCGVFSVLLLIAGSAYAQQDRKLVLNDERECVLGNLAFIDAATGDLKVSVQNLEDCLGDEAGGLAVSPLLPTASSVNAGESLEILWTSTSEQACEATGDLPGWSNSNVGTTGPTSFTVPSSAAAGTYEAAVRCPAGDPNGVENSTNITVAVEDVDPPPAPNVSVSPTSVSPGGSVTVEWTSTNASSCTVPTGANRLPGWNGSKSPSGEEDIDISGSLAAGTYNVSLRCSNEGGDSDTTEEQVIVESETPSECGPERQPPSNWSRASGCTVNGNGNDCRNYADFFGGFPGTTSIRHFTLQPNQYAAMAFTPDSVPAGARADLNMSPLQGFGIPNGNPIWSISTCPGDFSPEAIENAMGDAACLLSGSNAQFGFRFGGSSYLDSSSRCGLALEPGTTYFLNIVYSNDDPHTTPSSELSWMCGVTSSEQCGHQVQPNSLSGW